MKLTNIPCSLLTSLFFCGLVTAPARCTTIFQPGTDESAFESGGFVNASQFVPVAMMSSSLHSVGDQAYNNGLQNSYELSSGGVTTHVLGTHQLLQRIKELQALDYLHGLSKTDEFTKAIAVAAGDKVKSVVQIAKDPIGTVKNLPMGASRFFGSIGEGLKEAGHGNGSKAIENASGMSKAKARLAFKLGVSPYTDNQELQEQLTNVAWAEAGGGLVLSAASTIVPGAAGTALTAVGGNQILQNQLIDTPPNQLRIMNRKKLFALGLDRDQADAFLMQPYYTPVNSTVIVDALSRIGVSAESFLKEAETADNPEDAFYFQRLAQLLLQYQRTASPIASINVKDGLVCALDKNGTLVVPVSLDYAIWSERVSKRVEAFSSLLSLPNTKVKSLALWTDGQLSPRLCDELGKRSISYKSVDLENLASK